MFNLSSEMCFVFVYSSCFYSNKKDRKDKNERYLNINNDNIFLLKLRLPFFVNIRQYLLNNLVGSVSDFLIFLTGL